MSNAHVRRDMRKHSRRSVELPVLVSDAANRVKAGIRFGTTEVSAGGAFLRSDLLFEVGEILNLQIEIPPNRRILAVGRVVRVSRGTPQDRLAGMGIEFVDLPPADRAALETAIR
ncbi:MAG: PilZ domain-containing protein [Deltaproteobacteria bacterium]|nr:PilZ domain-containing protein [Deltaproteobacteria bacterium]